MPRGATRFCDHIVVVMHLVEQSAVNSRQSDPTQGAKGNMSYA